MSFNSAYRFGGGPIASTTTPSSTTSPASNPPSSYFSKYNALYNNVKAQNDLIDSIIVYLKDNNTLNETTTSYIDKEINNIKYTSNPLFYVYCVCIIVLCVVLLIYKPLNFKLTVIVVILLLRSPFYLIQLELFMYNILVYIYSLLSGIVYRPV